MSSIPQLTQWTLATRNLLRQKRRNVFATTMIGVSFAAMVLLSAHGDRMVRHWIVNASYANYFGHVSVYKKDALDRQLVDPKHYLLSAADQAFLAEKLRDFPEVEFTGRYLVSSGLISNSCESVPFLGTGVDLAVEERIHSHPMLTKWLASVDRSAVTFNLAQFTGSIPNAIAITPSLAARLGKLKTLSDLGNADAPFEPITDCSTPRTQSLIANTADAQLMVQDSRGDSAIYDGRIAYHFSSGRMFTEDIGLRTSLDFMQKLLRTDGVTYLAVFLKDSSAMQSFMERFQTEGLKERAGDFALYSAMGSELNALDNGAKLWNDTMEIFTEVLLGLVIAIIVANFLTMTIRERRVEIGTLRALGFEPRAIMAVFQKEVVLIILIGLLLGGAVAPLVTQFANNMGYEYNLPGVPGATFFQLSLRVAEALKIAAGLALCAFLSSVAVLRWTVSDPVVADLLKGTA